MKFASLFFCYLTILLNLYAFINVYERTTIKNIKVNITNIIVFFLLATLAFFANYVEHSFLKIFITIFVTFSAYKIFYKESIKITLFKLFIIYAIIYVCDFLVSSVFLFFPFKSVLDLGKVTVLKALCTILVSLLLLLIFSFDLVNNFFNNLVEYVFRKLNIFYLIIPLFTLLVFIVLIYFYANILDLWVFLGAVLLLSFFLLLCFIMISQYFKNKHNEEEQKSLLELMNEYERILENDRINRHEMLNNLVTLKTFKDKASNEYEQILDDIIKSYQIKKSEFYSKLYKLPSGIKGIIYYKIANIRDKDINVELLISEDVKRKFETLSSRLYFRVCKILGIIIDNAFEAAIESKEKTVLIDIYLEDLNIIFYVENSFLSNIDIDKITDKGQSSKGRNRGYGLFIANKLIKEKDDIVLEQHIDKNNFISILTIKNP